jgi:hypothetical protein
VPTNLETSLDGAQQEIAAQLSIASSLDAKLSTLLAFLVSLVGVLLSVPGALADWRWILLVGLSLSSLVCLWGTAVPDDPTSGPDMVRYYDDYGSLAPEAFMRQLLADLAWMIAMNKDLISRRRSMLSGSLGFAVTGPVVYGLARAFF